LKKIKLIYKFIFWLALTAIAISIFTLTFGQIIPIEFKNNTYQSDFYSFIFFGLPLSIGLTLFGTIKNQNNKLKNLLIGFSTIVLSVICFFVLVTSMFSIGFGAWTNETILYRNKSNEELTINQQIYDLGAFGYGKRRTAELKPFFKYFEIVKIIDTSKIDKTKWLKVNEEGDLHFP
jgi:hypothetical protein